MFRGVHKLLVISILTSIAFLAGISFYKKDDIDFFFGIAESKEVSISFERNVSIKRMHVNQGKPVKKGELLLELEQSELDTQIEYIKGQIEIFSSRKNGSTLKGKVNKLPVAAAPTSSNEEEENLLDNELEDSDSESLSPDDNLKVLKNKLKAYEIQKAGLLVYAPDDSVIGEIFFKEGEKVAAFTPILNLQTQAPHFIKAYIHENMTIAPKRGQRVEVRSIGRKSYSSEAKIIAVGEKIVAFPKRLKTRPELPLWGREIFIEVPKESPFLMNEKVAIVVKDDAIFGISTEKEEERPFFKALRAQEHNISIPIEISERTNLEPSGLLYLNDLKKVLMLSDELPSDRKIEFYQMSTQGIIELKVLEILDPPVKAKDLESFSVDQNGNITVLCSLSYSKGSPSKSRNQLLWLKRDKTQLSFVKAVNLRKLLEKWALKNSKSEAAKFISEELNVEGHFWSGKDLYLGLKEPFSAEGNSVILKVTNALDLESETLLANEQVSIWQTLNLTVADKAMGISDLVFLNGTLYILSSCPKDLNQGVCGAFWKLEQSFESSSNGLKMIRFFDSIKPEGLTVNSDTREFILAFDAGRKGRPTMITIPEKDLIE